MRKNVENRKKNREIEKTEKVAQEIMKDDKRSNVISICLLFHTEVRWFSRGNVFSRFIKLKNELLIFFPNADMDDFAKHLQNDDCNKNYDSIFLTV